MGRGSGLQPDNTFTWTPGPPDVGTYLLQVWVRSAGSSAPFETWGATPFFDILAPPPLTVTAIIANQTFPSAAGVPITWTALAANGNPPIQYQFWRLKLGVGWVLGQDYSPNNTYTWTPGPSDTGTYLLQVWVRSAGSSALYDNWSATPFFDILGSPALTVTALNANRTFPSAAGVPVTWSASAAGGTSPAQFKFYLLDVGTGTWTLLQDYSPSSSVTWTPTKGGLYVVQVWARSATSIALYDDWRGTGFFSILP